MTDDFNMPWSASDVAKAMRETLAATRDAVKLFRYMADLYNHRKARKAATNLESLHFAPNGMLQPLLRIADGKGSPDDFKRLAQIFEDTATGVQRSIDHLGKYQSSFRENLGLAATITLYEKVIWSKIGKLGIRKQISKLLECAGHTPVDAHRVQEIAADTIVLVEGFNEQLARLHDLVLPPKKKVRSRKQDHPRKAEARRSRASGSRAHRGK